MYTWTVIYDVSSFLPPEQISSLWDGTFTQQSSTTKALTLYINMYTGVGEHHTCTSV